MQSVDRAIHSVLVGDHPALWFDLYVRPAEADAPLLVRVMVLEARLGRLVLESDYTLHEGEDPVTLARRISADVTVARLLEERPPPAPPPPSPIPEHPFAEHARLRAIVEGAHDGIVTVGADGRIRFANRAIAHMFGWSPEELVGQPLDVLLPERARGRHAMHVAAFRRAGDTSRSMHERAHVTALRRDGTEFPAQISIARIELASGVELTAILRDVTETARLIAELRETGSRDALTKLATRRAFVASLVDELSRAQRFGRPLSLALFDVDHLRRINDAHGHVAGDALLRDLAVTITRAARSTDVVGRIGGDELAVLMPSTDLAGARAAARRIRAAAAGLVVDHGGASLHATVSGGLAMFRPDTDAPALLEVAARALDRAKRLGRNRVIVQRAGLAA